MIAPNPSAALDALTHPATTKVGRFEVRELTLGTMAVLQKIGSPLAAPGKELDFPAVVELLYVLTRPAGETLRLLAVGRDAFEAEAYAWADGVTNAEATELLQAAFAATGRIHAANPSSEEPDEEAGNDAVPDPTAAGPTAGSPGA